jgi:hypothetical protein
MLKARETLSHDVTGERLLLCYPDKPDSHKTSSYHGLPHRITSTTLYVRRHWRFVISCNHQETCRHVRKMLCFKSIKTGKKQKFTYLSDILPLNEALLVLVSAHTPIHVSVVGTVHFPEELLVMRDDKKLEVCLFAADLDDLGQRLCKALDVLLVEVGRGLVEGDESAVGAEAFREGEADDD